MDIVIRRAEPADYEAMASILGDPLAYPGTHRAYALRDGHYAGVHSMARIKQKPVPCPV